MKAKSYFALPAFCYLRSALTVVAVAVAGLALAAAPARAVTSASSGLWAGLVTAGGGYTSVTADVTVPRVTALCGANSNVVAFVGLGGWSGLPFVQNGFTVTPKGMGVWSEVFDKSGAGPVTSVSLPIRAGDKIRLSIVFSADRSALVFGWNNLTLKRSVSRRVTNASRYYNGSTADFIVERSWYPYRGAPLARFSPISFSNAKALRRGAWVPAYNSGSTKVTLQGARGNRIASVTSAAGTAFTASWAGCS